MLSLVTAAEQQYRQDAAARERDFALLVSIRARRSAERASSTVPAPRRERAAEPRPVGARVIATEPCPAAMA